MIDSLTTVMPPVIPGLVSVVIPAYNQAEYLREAIQSALSQTYPYIEIIVVDDGSTDHTRQVCESVGSPVRYIYQDNDGTRGAGARARAILMSRGEWVAILDQDDRWLPTKLEKQVEVLKNSPETGVVFTGVRMIHSDGRDADQDIPYILFTPAQPGCAFHDLLKGNHYCASSAFVSRRVLSLEDLKENSKANPADWDLWLTITNRHKVNYISEKLVDYRVHGDSYSLKSRVELMRSGRHTLRRHGRRLHPGCSDCKIAFRQAIRTTTRAASLSCLDMYHLEAREGRLIRSLPYLLSSVYESPFILLNLRRFLAVMKSGGLAFIFVLKILFHSNNNRLNI